MIAFADTNWLVAAYFVNSRTPVVERFAEKHDWPWQVAPPVLLECHSVFPRLARQANPPQLKQLKADLGSKLILQDLPWNEIEERAKELLARFAHKAELGVFDAMLVASAKAAGTEWFLCFDTNSNARAMAAALKMRVFPELAEEDKKRLAALR